GEDREHGTQRQHVVEVSNHIVGVVQGTVGTSVGEHHTGHTTNGEQEDEANCPEHRGTEGDRATPHRRDPGEDLNAGGHCDNHGCRHEVALNVEAQAGGVHVVSPHDEADETNGDHSVGHCHVTEDGLAGEGCHDVADDAEARQDHDVHSGVRGEPEQVLVEDRIATPFSIEEGRA